MELDVDSRVLQDTFAGLVGVSQQRVAQYIAEGVLQRDGTCRQWLLAYCERLREQAAGRGQELTIERAALARAQRRGQEIKNRVAEGEYAAIGLLTDVLAQVSSAVAQRFDSLAPELGRRCPDLTDAQRAAVLDVVARARNEWERGTVELAVAAIDGKDAGDDDSDDQLALELPADASPDARPDDA